MVYLFLCLSIGIFVLCLKVLGLIPKVLGMIATTRQALNVMSSKEMSDEAKEAAVQKASLAVLKAFFVIAFCTAVTVALPIAFVAAVSMTGLYSLEAAWLAAGNLYFLIGSSIVMIAAMVVLR